MIVFEPGTKVIYHPEKNIRSIWKRVGKIDADKFDIIKIQKLQGFLIINSYNSDFDSYRIRGSEYDWSYPLSLFTLYDK